jgi:hypothetical protein
MNDEEKWKEPEKPVPPRHLPNVAHSAGLWPLLIVADEYVAGVEALLKTGFSRDYDVLALSAISDAAAFAGCITTILPAPGEAARAEAERLFDALVVAEAARVRLVDATAVHFKIAPMATTGVGDEVRRQAGQELRRIVRDAAGFASLALIDRLARMDDATFAGKRKPISDRTGITGGELTQLRKRRRIEIEQAEQAALDVKAAPAPIVPAALRVDGVRLLDDLAAEVRRYISARPEELDAITLWPVIVHCQAAFEVAPQLLLTSEEDNEGKTTVLEFFERTVPRPDLSDKSTAAAVRRLINIITEDEAAPPTLLIDELDHPTDELRVLLNGCHRRGKKTWITIRGKPTPFLLFAPVALGMIGRPHKTTASRSILIHMQRALPEAKLADWVSEKSDPKVIVRQADLASRIARWSQDNVSSLLQARPTLSFINRNRDNWRPFIAVAEAIGGTWPERIQRAAMWFEARRTYSYAGTLAADIRDVLPGLPRQRQEEAAALRHWGGAL